jgi:hypothetical protein
MLPPDEGAGPLIEPAPGPAAEQQVNRSLPDQGDCRADPFEVGEVLRLWVGIQMDCVDALIDEAESKVTAIPDLRTLRAMMGEWVVLTYSLQAEVTDLRGDIHSLKARLKGRRP